MDHNPQKAFKVKANNALQTLEKTQRNLSHITCEVHHKPSLMYEIISMNVYNSYSYQMPSAGQMLLCVCGVYTENDFISSLLTEN